MNTTDNIIKDRFGRECFCLGALFFPVKSYHVDHYYNNDLIAVYNDEVRSAIKKAGDSYGVGDTPFCYGAGEGSFPSMPLKQCRAELRKIHPYDYTDDSGSVYCGLCREIKIQTYIDDNCAFKEKLVPCRCLNRVEGRFAERRESAFGANNVMQNYMFENADMASEFMHKCEKYADKFVRDGEKQFSLLLFGGVGHGKTYAAACIANRLIDKGISVLFTSVSKFERGLWAEYVDKSTVYDELTKPDLLVIDDLASERDTDYMHEIQFNMIQTRLECGKPMIVTTNLTAKQLTDPDDLRIARVNSRILENSYALLCEGKDRRLEKFKENAKHFSEQLKTDDEDKSMQNG